MGPKSQKLSTMWIIFTESITSLLKSTHSSDFSSMVKNQNLSFKCHLPPTLERKYTLQKLRVSTLVSTSVKNFWNKSFLYLLSDILRKFIVRSGHIRNYHIHILNFKKVFGLCLCTGVKPSLHLLDRSLLYLDRESFVSVRTLGIIRRINTWTN